MFVCLHVLRVTTFTQHGLSLILCIHTRHRSVLCLDTCDHIGNSMVRTKTLPSRLVISQNTLYMCRECGNEYTHLTNLIRHKRDLHKKERISIELNIKFSCSECTKEYSQKRSLVRHIRETHRKKDAFTCAHCGKAYCKKENLRKHLDDCYQTGNNTTNQIYILNVYSMYQLLTVTCNNKLYKLNSTFTVSVVI